MGEKTENVIYQDKIYKTLVMIDRKCFVLKDESDKLFTFLTGIGNFNPRKKTLAKVVEYLMGNFICFQFTTDIGTKRELYINMRKSDVLIRIRTSLKKEFLTFSEERQHLLYYDI